MSGGPKSPVLGEAVRPPREQGQDAVVSRLRQCRGAGARQIRAAGKADRRAVFAALNEGGTRVLEAAWPGEVVTTIPARARSAGTTGAAFISHNMSWLRAARAYPDRGRTCADGRAVVVLLARLDHDGRELAWPVAVSPSLPTICRWCSDPTAAHGRSTSASLRPPILKPEHVPLGDAVGRYEAALAAVTPRRSKHLRAGWYFRALFGPDYADRGTAALRAFLPDASAQARHRPRHRAVTDDGVRCALVHCLRWGSHDLPTQAGIVVYGVVQTGCWARPRLLRCRSTG